MTLEAFAEQELTLNRFHRLFRELLAGNLARNSFQPWEIRVIMDYRECRLPGKRRAEILRQYDRAVTRQMQTGPGPPMTLSEFLAVREQRRKENGLVEQV